MSNVDFKRVEAILYNYPVLKVEIKNMKLDLEILENDYKGVNAISYEEKSGPTHKISSSVEDEVLKRDEEIISLRKTIRYKELELQKIENTLELFSEKEVKFIELKYFLKVKHIVISSKLDMSYDYINEYRTKLISKIIQFNIL